VLFLHSQGYDFFNIGKLTYNEVNWLVEAYNTQQKRLKKEAEKASKKSKSKR